ncbi:response regulator transcription factor [Petroclostridium sp. X23]|uniref:response regulator transcription factor n=1 Tax=Petroclostridium sp. X23 TaxID=3045146 RepID=UPI0024AC8BFF|nr:response regulator transcription factor [Petroclostridium sp. X23]WHH56915.1 response regulator transcription factor [Petroclostridium sp. X23]
MGEKLLIVEDDEAIAGILKEHLQKEGYDIVWSSGGKEGLEDFKNGDFDLVILDLMLPEMDGFSLCKNIRWLDKEVPIIIVSARQEDFDKVKGLKLGADDYITKPFSLVEVSARVEAHLRRFRNTNFSSDSNTGINFLHGLTVFPEGNSVFLNGEEISLTSKEFQLLNLMMQNPNKIFSKEELYENIWENIDISGNNTVTVHIKALREKLKDSIKNPDFIQTVWGVGYKFIGERII